MSEVIKGEVAFELELEGELVVKNEEGKVPALLLVLVAESSMGMDGVTAIEGCEVLLLPVSLLIVQTKSNSGRRHTNNKPQHKNTGIHGTGLPQRKTSPRRSEGFNSILPALPRTQTSCKITTRLCGSKDYRNKRLD